MEKQHKNTISIIMQLTGTKITFCYGHKAYHKYVKKNLKAIEYINEGGVCTSWKGKDFQIVVGVKKNKDIYALKALIVHELSHAVTQYFNEYGFKCDEQRSYTLQYLYQNIMPFIDEIVTRDYNISIEKKQNTKGKHNGK